MSGSNLHCRQAADDLVRILSELRRRELVKGPVSDETVRHALYQCQPCRGRGASRRKCLGWKGSFNQATAIEIPFEVEARHVTAKVSGFFDFRRPKRQNWQDLPAAAVTFSIELWEVTDSEPCARHHIDLANPSQAGPVWHLQMGGLASGEGRNKAHSWLKIPRWPTLPMDMILVLELAIYNFRHEAWVDLRTTNPWRDIIKRSEKLMHHHYVERLKDYCNRSEVGDSWLAYQCNQTSGWNPRPS